MELTHSTTSSPTGLWERFASHVRGWFDIPFGYEDENGFHYGQEPGPAATPGLIAAESRKLFTDRASDAIPYASTWASQPEATPIEERRVSA